MASWLPLDAIYTFPWSETVTELDITMDQEAPSRWTWDLYS